MLGPYMFRALYTTKWAPKRVSRNEDVDFWFESKRYYIMLDKKNLLNQNKYSQICDCAMCIPMRQAHQDVQAQHR